MHRTQKHNKNQTQNLIQILTVVCKYFVHCSEVMINTNFYTLSFIKDIQWHIKIKWQCKRCYDKTFNTFNILSLTYQSFKRQKSDMNKVNVTYTPLTVKHKKNHIVKTHCVQAHRVVTEFLRINLKIKSVILQSFASTFEKADWTLIKKNNS